MHNLRDLNIVIRESMDLNNIPNIHKSHVCLEEDTHEPLLGNNIFTLFILICLFLHDPSKKSLEFNWFIFVLLSCDFCCSYCAIFV